jgi:hypothetical protein
MMTKIRDEFFKYIVSLHEEIHNHDIFLWNYYENDIGIKMEDFLELNLCRIY